MIIADGTVILPYSIGRSDCVGSPPDVGLPIGNLITTVNFLNRAFGVSTKEAVALIGKSALRMKLLKW